MKADVDTRLPMKQIEVETFVINAEMREHRLTKERQQNKFQRLNDKITAESQCKNNNKASECMTRWVKNCSDRILSVLELSILKKGLNFTITPKHLPIVDIITATESACRSLKGGDASELRAKVVNIINKHDKIKDENVSNEEWKAIDNLKADDYIMILPADKGRVTVVMNKPDYYEKCYILLRDEKTYQKLKSDRTQKFLKQFVSALKDLKDRKVIDYETVPYC